MPLFALRRTVTTLKGFSVHSQTGDGLECWQILTTNRLNQLDRNQASLSDLSVVLS